MGRKRRPKDLDEVANEARAAANDEREVLPPEERDAVDRSAGPGVADVAEAQAAVAGGDLAQQVALLQSQMQTMATQNQMLLAILQNNGGITQPQEKEIVNNGWRVMLNEEHHNPDNMDWNPQLGGRRLDPNNPTQDVPRELYVGDGKYEWGYKDPRTGKVKWSGKLIGSHPPGPPKDPPKPIAELREELAYADQYAAR